MELIDKAAVKAGLERIEYETNYEPFTEEVLGKRKVCIDIKDFIETLELKEVDLEVNSFDATVCKNGNTYLKEMDRNAIVKVLEPYEDGDKVKVIIKAQK